MPDLYETLGVQRDANAAEIKSAYRARAKTAHPDHGGSTEQFGALALAYDVLRDEHRRQEYDRTGRIEPNQADNQHVAALQIITQALEHAMSQALEMDVANPLSRNILELAKSLLRNDLKTAKQNSIRHNKNAKLSRRAAEKFTRQEGENHISSIFTAKAEAFEAAAKSADTTAELLQRALDLLGEYTFTPDAAAPKDLHTAMAASFAFAQGGI